MHSQGVVHRDLKVSVAAGRRAHLIADSGGLMFARPPVRPPAPPPPHLQPQLLLSLIATGPPLERAPQGPLITADDGHSSIWMDGKCQQAPSFVLFGCQTRHNKPGV